MTAVRAVQLTKVYGKTAAVDHLDLDVPTRGVFGLLGPNGAGKSTTLRMLLGLVRPTDGWFELLGRVRGDRDFHESLRKIGALIEGPALYTALTGRRNLEVHARYLTIRSPAARVDAVLAAVGLRDRADDRVRTYSLGMRQRLGIAIALLGEPELLILDEPTVGVDPQSRNQILESIETLGGAGLAVLYTTHYMEEAERLCDRVAIIDEGRIVAEGTRRELIAGIGEHDRVMVEADGDIQAFAEQCSLIPGVASATVTAGGVEIVADEAAKVLAPVVNAAEQADVTVNTVEVREPDLEAVFLALTGKALRD